MQTNMISDMSTDDIVGDYRTEMLTYFDGTKRTVYVTDKETPFPDGKLIVSVTDTNGIILQANEPFVYMSGYDRDALIGKPHYILRHPDMPAGAYESLWSDVKTNGHWKGYVKNLRKDGGFYWVYASVIANVRKGEVTGFTSVRRRPSREKIDDSIALYQTMGGFNHA